MVRLRPRAPDVRRDPARAALGLVLLLAAMLHPRAAWGQLACDAGTVCPDQDNDGFAACGCPWSGTPCDCDDSDPAKFPGAPEACDSTKDDNCSAVVADPCPRAMGCYASACVPECVPLSDFGCAEGSIFFQTDAGRCLCAPTDCTVFGCPAGATCDDAKTCVPNCSPGVQCPHGQVCRGFGCVDPCAEVACPGGAVCDRGRCLPSCACAPGSSCPQGKTCDMTAPVASCVDPECVGIRCPPASHCDHGKCVDDCEGVVCPPKRLCRKVSVNGTAERASCVDLCSPDPCTPGYACDWRTGKCVEVPVAEGGLTPPSRVLIPLEVAGAGWSCAATRFASVSAVAGCGVAFAGTLLALRRRRRFRRRPR